MAAAVTRHAFWKEKATGRAPFFRSPAHWTAGRMNTEGAAGTLLMAFHRAWEGPPVRYFSRPDIVSLQ